MRIGVLSIVALLVLVGFAGMPASACCKWNTKTPLMAGQNIEVGYVFVVHDTENFYITYKITDCNWYITETHVALSTDGPDYIPTTGSGSPMLGHFPIKGEHDYVKEVTYTVPFNSDKIGDEEGDGFTFGESICIAAHAVVKKKNCAGEVIQEETAWGKGPGEFAKSWAMYFCYKPCEFKVPELPTGPVGFYVKIGADSYFDTTITSGGGTLPDGPTYEGWCVDIQNTINTNKPYTGTLSLPDFTDCNWNKVNWIINNKPSPVDKEVVQAAIWYYTQSIDPDESPNTLSPAQETAAWNLINAASNKCWFRPASGDMVAVILTPPDGVQLTIIEIDP